MYDWANSAFATTVMAGFFPIFFKQYWSYGADVNVSTAQLGFGNSIASLLVALMAPILGAIADKGSAKKKFLIFFAYLGVLMTAGVVPGSKRDNGPGPFSYMPWALSGLQVPMSFMIPCFPAFVGEEKIDYVSGLGFAMGYLGGGLLFLVNVLMTLMPQKFGLPDAAAAVRYAVYLRGRLVGSVHAVSLFFGYRKRKIARPATRQKILWRRVSSSLWAPLKKYAT